MYIGIYVHSVYNQNSQYAVDKAYRNELSNQGMKCSECEKCSILLETETKAFPHHR